MIRIYETSFNDDDAEAVKNVVKGGIVSSLGKEVKELENGFKDWVGRGYASTCSNGTAALVLALYGHDLTNVRVAVPNCSFAATAFAALDMGNRVSFVDIDIDSWNMDFVKLEEACKKYLNTDPIKAVICVHNYGNPYDYNILRTLADTYGFLIIEDACEAMYAQYGGKWAGSLGDISVFSFYANKLISAAEGGIVLTDDQTINSKINLYKSQGQDPNRRFWHLIPAFNYRHTALQSALALSQFKRIDKIQARKLEIANIYLSKLSGKFKFQKVHPLAKHSWWMVSIASDIDNFYDKAKKVMEEAGFETRPIFPPMDEMPAFNNLHDGSDLSVSKWLHEHGISLPSGPDTKNEDILRLCDLLLNIN